MLWTVVAALATGCSAAGGPGPDYFVVPDRLTDGLGDISPDAGSEPNDAGELERAPFEAAFEPQAHAIDDVDSERPAFGAAVELEDFANDD
jgi:hypothetical protein